jgi:hypothetical protein
MFVSVFLSIHFIKATGNIRFCDRDIKRWKGYPVMIGLCASKIDIGQPSNGKRYILVPGKFFSALIDEQPVLV